MNAVALGSLGENGGHSNIFLLPVMLLRLEIQFLPSQRVSGYLTTTQSSALSCSALPQACTMASPDTAAATRKLLGVQEIVTCIPAKADCVQSGARLIRPTPSLSQEPPCLSRQLETYFPGPGPSLE